MALFQEITKLQPLVAEISWTKNVIIMECFKDIRHEFYNMPEEFAPVAGKK